MADVTFLVDGTNLESAGVRLMEQIAGAHTFSDPRGDLLTFPGRDGMTNVDRPFDAGTISFGIVVVGPTRQGFNDNYRTLKRLLKPAGTVTLTRQLSYTSGAESHTALAKFGGGLEPAQIAPGEFRMVVRFLLLDGLWFGSPVTIGAGTSTITGDVRTRRMTVTLSAGTNPTVTNSTNGWALTYTGSTSTAVVIDVESMTATQGASDVSGNLSWTKDFPMQLEAGSNTLAITSGTLSIAYSPAYL